MKMVEYVNMIMRNEDVQGREEIFGTWKGALEKALYDTEHRNMSLEEAEKYRIEIWRRETETGEMKLYQIVPFVKKWEVEVNLHADMRADFQTLVIKARNAREAANNVMAHLGMSDVPEENSVQFEVYLADDWGECFI